MSQYPVQSQTPWGDALRSYIDGQDLLAPRKATNTRSIIVYGDSFTVDNGYSCSDGLEYHKQVANEATPGVLPTSYGVGGRRVNDVAAWMLNGGWSYNGGAHPAGGAATWPGADVAQRPLVIDAAVNAIAHYPDMTVPVAVPADISGVTGDRYIAGIAASLRTAIAIGLSASRVEDSAGTKTGSWALQNNAGSAGSISYTTTAGDSITYTVTPPQGGPMAGDIYWVGYALSTESGSASASITYQVDGGAASAVVAAPGWQRYKGFGGTNVDFVPWVVKIPVPVDGNSHAVKINHAGSTGQFMYADCVLVPSRAPLAPVFVMASPMALSETAVAPAFDAAGRAVWHRNRRKIEDAYVSVVSEFPSTHVRYVPSNISPNGLSYTDGVHPNDRGMEQRANDLLGALWTMRGWMLGTHSRFAADSEYASL